MANSSIFGKCLVTLLSVGGVATGNALGIINTSKENRVENPLSSLDMVNNHSNLVTKETENSSDFLEETKEEIADSSENHEKVDSLRQEQLPNTPKDQPESQKEVDIKSQGSLENPLERQDNSQLVVQEEQSKSPIQDPLPLSQEEDDVPSADLQVTNGGYFIFELSEGDEGFAEDEWEIYSCEKDEKDGKVILSCPWNYTGDGKRINFYINSDVVKAKGYDWNKLSELSWTPYGNDNSDLTLTFGDKNLVVELARGPKN